MKQKPSMPHNPEPTPSILKAFSHAFGGGSLIRADALASAGLGDRFFGWFFKKACEAYGKMVLKNVSRQCKLSGSTLLGFNCQLNNDGPAENISIGSNTIVRGILNASRGGKIKIGNSVYVGDNTCLYSMAEIEIGDGTMIAHGVNIFDNDTHHKDWALRKAEFERLFKKSKQPIPPIRSSPISIGENCWIASGVCIFKGCKIGARSIISAGTIVTKDVPEDSLAYGQEKMCIRSLS